MDERENESEPEVYASALPDGADERVSRLHRYWLSIHPQGGGLPGRQHFDPIDVPLLLPWIWLVDIQRSPLRFRQRLTGTEQVRVMERDVTGMWLDEAHPKFLSSPAYPQFVRCAQDGALQYRRGPPLFHLSKEYLSVERLLLPLAHDGSSVDMMLAITVYHRRPTH